MHKALREAARDEDITKVRALLSLTRTQYELNEGLVAVSMFDFPEATQLLLDARAEVSYDNSLAL